MKSRRWLKQDPTGLDQGIIDLCATCTSKDCFKASTDYTKELRLPAKQRNLKDSAVYLFSPKDLPSANLRSGAMEWAGESNHYQTFDCQGLVLHSTDPSITNGYNYRLSKLCMNIYIVWIIYDNWQCITLV